MYNKYENMYRNDNKMYKGVVPEVEAGRSIVERSNQRWSSTRESIISVLFLPNMANFKIVKLLVRRSCCSAAD